MIRGFVVVDSDAHVVEPPDMWSRYIDNRLKGRAPRHVAERSVPIEVDGERIPPNNYPIKPITFMKGEGRFKRAGEQNFNGLSYLESMNEEGIDLSVLFPSVGLFIMGAAKASPDVMSAVATAYNTWLSELCAEGKNRLFGVGMLDLRDIAGACREAVRCVKDLGFVGLFVRPNPVNGKPFNDPGYEPLWSVIEDLDVPICFHEGGIVALPQIGPDRFGTAKRHLWHMTTHVVENQMAMVAMVLGGVCERHPKLRCGFMECGAGWLPYWMWRMDEHAEVSAGKDLSEKPSEYVRRQCFVSADTDEGPAINTMSEMKGGNVLWASDYPHQDSKYPHAVRTITTLPGIDPYIEQVLWRNPVKFYGGAVRKAAETIAVHKK